MRTMCVVHEISTKIPYIYIYMCVCFCMKCNIFEGYYKPSATAVYTERSPGGDFDFMSRLCADWEKRLCIFVQHT